MGIVLRGAACAVVMAAVMAVAQARIGLVGGVYGGSGRIAGGGTGDWPYYEAALKRP